MEFGTYFNEFIAYLCFVQIKEIQICWHTNMFLFTLYTLSIIISNKSSMIDQCSNDTESLPTFLLSGFLWMQPLHAPPPPSHHGNHAAGKPRRSGPAIIVDGKRSRQTPFKDTISCLLSCSSAGNGMVQLRLRLNAFFFFCLNKINGAWLITYNDYICMLIFKTW